MKRKQTILMGFVMAASMLSAQNSVSYTEFEQRVLEYSQTLKQSVAQRTAMQKAMQVAKTAFLPAIDGGGSYQYRINDLELGLGGAAMAMDKNTYSLDLGVSQPIYAGGTIYNRYKASKIQVEMADKAIELTTDNLIYAAQSSYWGCAAQRAMYETMREYVETIEELVKILQYKYDDGLISKTDLIQMQARLKEAQLQQSNTYQSYQVSLQNMNVLMGIPPLEELILSDAISDLTPTVEHVGADKALSVRPDFTISQLEMDYQKRQVKLTAGKYNPTLAVGFKQSWGTQMINISGETVFNSNLYASLNIPILRWGARFKSVASQKAILLTKQYALQDKQDQISREVAKAWTNMTEYKRQLELAKDNCALAEENLELNTFSYTEGKLTVLDVLSAQLTWIQANGNLIQTEFNEKLALADYRKAVGMRYLEEAEESAE
ncbi:MAG: TolC family protein [Phocaeicola sp.]